MQVPAPPLSLTVPVELVPSPHAIEQVCVSAVPASPKDAFAVTEVFVWNDEPLAGELTETVGARFATEIVKPPVADAPVLSVTFTLTA